MDYNKIGYKIIDMLTDKWLDSLEMVHVRQWALGKWRGNGEKEALRLQYKIADTIWKGSLL